MSNFEPYVKDFFRPRRKKSETAKACAPEPTSFGSIADTFLISKGFTEIQRKLVYLYAHWEMTLGEELACIAYPIGHRNKILIIAGENSIAMNELNYAQDEILDRVHSFLEEEYFESVELQLLQDKTPLNQIPQRQEIQRNLLEKPKNLGNLDLPEGKVRDAYLHYLSLFEEDNA